MDIARVLVPSVDPATFAVAAAILSVERVTYVAVWRWPARFQGLCRSRGLRWLGSPVDVLATLFVVFKLVQLSVFVGWCLVHGGRLLPGQRSLSVLLASGALLALGQALNLSVFHALGRVGVFYGARFGHAVPWRLIFPFSWLEHPQYFGALLSVWGFFVLTRYPAPDWAALPLLQTVYYALGAHFEEDEMPVRATRS